MATAGKGGSVTVATDEIGEIQEWTIDEDVDLEETPVFGDEIVTHTATLKSASGSFSGYFDADDIDKVDPGTEAEITLAVDDTNEVSANAIIASRSVSNVVDGVAELDIDFEFQEEPTWTTT